MLDAILRHPALYLGPTMVKPPVVYTAGLLRALGRRVEGSAWVWLLDGAGQRLFYPPNVAGWDDARWLDTATFRGRWAIANEALVEVHARAEARPQAAAGAALGRGDRRQRASTCSARRASGRETKAALEAFARSGARDADEDWKRDAYPPLVLNAVRQLLAVSPDLQVLVSGCREHSLR